MGLFDRFRPRQALTSAATQVILKEEKEAARHKKRAQNWQKEAWRFYDEIPEIWFAMNYYANVMRRVRIFPATQPEPDKLPVPLTGPLGIRAEAELDRLKDQDGGHGEFLHDLSMQFNIPGEGYGVVNIGENGQEQCRVCSTEELFQNSNGDWAIREEPDDREGTPLHPDAFVWRMWRSHPKWRQVADSPMRGVLDVCDELQILSRHVRAAGRSRLNAGLFFYPSEAGSLKPVDGQVSQQDGNVLNIDPFLQMLLTVMTTPIQEEGSASAVVPGIVKMKGEWIEKLRHIDFSRSYDATALNERRELRERLATGLDLPAEIVTGKADLNHWSLWQVDDDTFKAHIEPGLVLMTSAITSGFLRVAMEDVGPEVMNVMTWFDASDLIAHPARSSDADGAHDRIVISDAAYRKYKGYSEDDAPDEAEMEERLERNRSKTAGGGLPAADKNPAEDADRSAPEADEEDAVAASAFPVHELGFKLRDMDRELRIRLQVASQGVVFRAMERIGAKLRRKAGRNNSLQLQIDGVPNHLVAQAFGEELVRSWFATDEDLLDDALNPMFPIYQKWVKRTQEQVLDLARKESRETGRTFDEAYALAQQNSERAAGWAVLSRNLSGLIIERIFNPEKRSIIASGELDSTMSVPAGAVREALAVAGGGQGTRSKGGAILGLRGGPTGGIASGPTSISVFKEVGLETDTWEWSYGDPGSRDNSFVGHEELDGVQFSNWEDPVLSVADEDDWIGEEFYFPGDHFDCQCEAVLVFVRKGA